MLFELIFELLLRFFDWLFAALLTPLLNLFPGHAPKFGLKREKKRQARGMLEHSQLLLRKGLIDQADIRFGAALKVYPQIVDCLSSRERRKLMLELVENGGGLNATQLWLQLENIEKAAKLQARLSGEP